MERLLLVDGHSYAYRAFYAIRDLTAPDGEPTNAVFGFIKMLSKIRGQVEPSHLAVIWDGGLSTERTGALPSYKSQRLPMPDSLATQIDQIDSYLQVAGIPALQQEGAEADDLIATLAIQAAVEGGEVVIASPDKDFFQLVTEGVGILNPNDKSARIWAAADVEAKTGVSPEQVVDWLSLIGDAVDNIPGVPGVGPKTAASLLRQFTDLDELFKRLPEVSSVRLRGLLGQAESDVRRNQSLIRLDSTVAGLPGWRDLVAGVPQLDDLLVLYRKWGFRGLAAEVEKARGGQGVLFAEAKS